MTRARTRTPRTMKDDLSMLRLTGCQTVHTCFRFTYKDSLGPDVSSECVPLPPLRERTRIFRTPLSCWHLRAPLLFRLAISLFCGTDQRRYVIRGLFLPFDPGALFIAWTVFFSLDASQAYRPHRSRCFRRPPSSQVLPTSRARHHRRRPRAAPASSTTAPTPVLRAGSATSHGYV